MISMIKRIIRKLVNVSFNRFVMVDRHTIIGRYTYIGPNSSITRANIGNYCSIGSGVSIGAGEHALDKVSTSSVFYDCDVYSELTREEVIIEHDVWIGTNAIVLRGVHISTGAVIGAGAVVTKNVPPYAIVVGVPAKIIKYRFEPSVIEKILSSQWWLMNKSDAKITHNKLIK